MFSLQAIALSKVNYEKDSLGCCHFYADNYGRVPEQVEVTFVYNKKKETRTALIEPLARKQLLFSIQPEEEFKTSDFKHSFSFYLGDPELELDVDHLYSFPFPTGSKYKLAQGYNGKYTHRNHCALDLCMNTGTKVCAARGGEVVQIKANSKLGGKDIKFRNQANFIIIMHDDGSIAKYVHLKYNGVKVKLGQKVVQGEFIGLSGNTGMTSGPHLHFEVFAPERGKRMKSIPVKFVSRDEDCIYLEGAKLRRFQFCESVDVYSVWESKATELPLVAIKAISFSVIDVEEKSKAILLSKIALKQEEPVFNPSCPPL